MTTTGESRGGSDHEGCLQPIPHVAAQEVGAMYGLLAGFGQDSPIDERFTP